MHQVIKKGITVPATNSRAIAVQDRLLELYESTQRNFIEVGVLIKEAEDKELWAQLQDSEGQPYTSLRHWLRVALPYGLASAYEARGVIRDMDDVPIDTLRSIPRANIKLLVKLPERARKSRKWLKQAETMSVKDFSEKIHILVPGSRGDVIRYNFSVPRGKDSKVVDKAFAICGEETKEGKFLSICSSYVAASSLHVKKSA